MLLAGAVPFHRSCTDHSHRGAARARHKRACCASSPQTANAVARLCAPRKLAARQRPLLVRRSTVSHRGREASRLVQCLFIGHDPTAASAARCGHVVSARAAPASHREFTQLRACVRRESRLVVGGRGWHVRSTGLHRGREASRQCSASTWGMYRPHPVRHGARASQARVLRLLPTDSQRSGKLAYATRTADVR